MSDRCGGTRRDGQPCRNPKGHRTTHPGYGNCSKHGGCTPNGLTHARRLAAEEAVLHFSLPRDIDPHDALLEEVHALAGNLSFIRSIVGENELTQRIYTEGGGSYEDVSVWVKLYWQAHDRLVRVSAAAIKAGVEERRVQIMEKQGELLAQAIKGILAELGVIDRPEVPGVVRRHLELVARSGPATEDGAS